MRSGLASCAFRGGFVSTFCRCAFSIFAPQFQRFLRCGGRFVRTFGQRHRSRTDGTLDHGSAGRSNGRGDIGAICGVPLIAAILARFRHAHKAEQFSHEQTWQKTPGKPAWMLKFRADVNLLSRTKNESLQDS